MECDGEFGFPPLHTPFHHEGSENSDCRPLGSAGRPRVLCLPRSCPPSTTSQGLVSVLGVGQFTEGVLRVPMVPLQCQTKGKGKSIGQ